MRPETASAPISFLMIPTIAVPVILLGTFAVLSLTGFSINTLTMFGMVRSPSAEILGEPAPGLSTGSAMDTMEKLAEKLPPGIGFDWTGLCPWENELKRETELTRLEPTSNALKRR